MSTVPDPSPVSSFGMTTRGLIRSRNEDALLDDPRAGLWVVADGMGGHACGDVASRMLTGELERLAKGSEGRALVEYLPRRIASVNETLLDYGHRWLKGAVVGTTVAAMIMEEENFHCFWAGDSRIHLLRAGALHRLTADHVATPLAADEEGPSRTALTRAVGAEPDLQLDYRHGFLYEGDVFLISTDGVGGILDDRDIRDSLRRLTAAAACDALIERVLDRGAPDNASCIVVCVSPAPA